LSRKNKNIIIPIFPNRLFLRDVYLLLITPRLQLGKRRTRTAFSVELNLEKLKKGRIGAMYAAKLVIQFTCKALVGDCDPDQLQLGLKLREIPVYLGASKAALIPSF
jgi:hypothetical protein